MMKSKKDGYFPFIRSEKVKKLLNERRIHHLVEMGMIERRNLDPIWVKHSHRCSRYSAYYYTLTNEALSLFDGTWTGIYKADQDYIESSIKSQLSPFYKRIGRQLEQFRIQLPNDEYYMSQFRKHVHKKHQDKPISKKVKIPFIPIHDAVLVPECRADEVEDYMRERSTKLFGYNVVIDRKELSRTAICKDDPIDELSEPDDTNTQPLKLESRF